MCVCFLVVSARAEREMADHHEDVEALTQARAAEAEQQRVEARQTMQGRRQEAQRLRA